MTSLPSQTPLPGTTAPASGAPALPPQEAAGRRGHGAHEIRQLDRGVCARPGCESPATGGWRGLCAAHENVALDIAQAWREEPDWADPQGDAA